MDKNYTKYDIMSKKIKSFITIILKLQFLAIKTYLISKEREKKEVECVCFNYILKHFDVLANILYEIYLDICSIPQEEFDRYFQEGVFSLADLSFATDVDDFTKILFFNAITLNENGNLYDRILKKVQDEKMDVDSAYGAVIAELTLEQKRYLKLFKNCNFEYHGLDDEEINILNSYHQEFMDKEITPYVTKTLDVKNATAQSIKVLKRIPSININVFLPFER